MRSKWVKGNHHNMPLLAGPPRVFNLPINSDFSTQTEKWGSMFTQTASQIFHSCIYFSKTTCESIDVSNSPPGPLLLSQELTTQLFIQIQKKSKYKKRERETLKLILKQIWVNRLNWTPNNNNQSNKLNVCTEGYKQMLSSKHYVLLL